MFCAHEAVGNVGIDTYGAGGATDDGFDQHTGQDALQAVFALGPVAIDHVAILARGPDSRKKRRIALSIGVDLEDPRTPAIARDAVSLETGLPMAAVGVAHDFKVESRVIALPIMKNLGSRISGSVIDDQDTVIGTGLIEFCSPFVENRRDRPLLVEGRNNDQKLRGHALLLRTETFKHKPKPRRRRPPRSPDHARLTSSPPPRPTRRVT